MEFIDDHPVVSHRVRFKNRAEIDEHAAALVRDDAVVVWLVRARCEPPQYFPLGRGSEERFRFNIQDVETAAPLDGASREGALAYLDHGAEQSYIGRDGARFPGDSLFEDWRPETAAAQLHRLGEYLEAAGATKPGETLMDTVRRLVEERPTGLATIFRDFELQAQA